MLVELHLKQHSDQNMFIAPRLHAHFYSTRFADTWAQHAFIMQSVSVFNIITWYYKSAIKMLHQCRVSFRQFDEVVERGTLGAGAVSTSVLKLCIFYEAFICKRRAGGPLRLVSRHLWCLLHVMHVFWLHKREYIITEIRRGDMLKLFSTFCLFGMLMVTSRPPCCRFKFTPEYHRTPTSTR